MEPKDSLEAYADDLYIALLEEGIPPHSLTRSEIAAAFADGLSAHEVFKHFNARWRSDLIEHVWCDDSCEYDDCVCGSCVDDD